MRMSEIMVIAIRGKWHYDHTKTVVYERGMKNFKMLIFVDNPQANFENKTILDFSCKKYKDNLI
jgi:hypothetical protein